ncbi:MAG: hypothetical protein HY696_08605 [Deltaproteobacteria bacterium]|nr:hypothetical protein [Deltaproteobacteria bacterium]
MAIYLALTTPLRSRVGRRPLPTPIRAERRGAAAVRDCFVRAVDTAAEPLRALVRHGARRVLQSSDNTVLQRMAYAAQVHSHTPEALDCLTNGLNHGDTDMRRFVLACIRRNGDLAMLPALRKRLRCETDVTLREQMRALHHEWTTAPRTVASACRLPDSTLVVPYLPLWRQPRDATAQ